MTGTEQTRRLLERFLDARLRNDRDDIRSVLTDDVVWTPPPSLPVGPFRGAEAVAEALLAGGYFDPASLHREVRALVCEGDTAFVRQFVRATTKNGREYVSDSVWMYECRNGLIARLDEYADSLNSARVFGWIED
jgi:ketosteroid isomerase-like protein